MGTTAQRSHRAPLTFCECRGQRAKATVRFRYALAERRGGEGRKSDCLYVFEGGDGVRKKEGGRRKAPPMPHLRPVSEESSGDSKRRSRQRFRDGRKRRWKGVGKWRVACKYFSCSRGRGRTKVGAKGRAEEHSPAVSPTSYVRRERGQQQAIRTSTCCRFALATSAGRWRKRKENISSFSFQL